MAGVIKVNGDMGAAGVANFFGGSKIRFFGVLVKNGSNQAVDMSGEGGVNEAWEAIYKAISLQATPVLFQYESGSTGFSSWGVETDGAVWASGLKDAQGNVLTAAAALQAAIRALGVVGANNVDVSGTVVTDVGFKLAVA